MALGQTNKLCWAAGTSPLALCHYLGLGTGWRCSQHIVLAQSTGRVRSRLPSPQHAEGAAATLTAWSSSLDFNLGAIHSHYQSYKKHFFSALTQKWSFSPEGDERCWNESLTKAILLTLALNCTALEQLFYWKLGIYTFVRDFLNKTAFLFKCFFGNTSSTLQRARLFSGLGGGAEEGTMRLTPCLRQVELPGFYPALRLTAFESPCVWSLTQKWHLYRQTEGYGTVKPKHIFLTLLQNSRNILC